MPTVAAATSVTASANTSYLTTIDVAALELSHGDHVPAVAAFYTANATLDTACFYARRATVATRLALDVARNTPVDSATTANISAAVDTADSASDATDVVATVANASIATYRTVFDAIDHNILKQDSIELWKRLTSAVAKVNHWFQTLHATTLSVKLNAWGMFLPTRPTASDGPTGVHVTTANATTGPCAADAAVTAVARTPTTTFITVLSGRTDITSVTKFSHVTSRAVASCATSNKAMRDV